VKETELALKQAETDEDTSCGVMEEGQDAKETTSPLETTSTKI
jgi:hypothetical protein